ncbi:MAG: DUF2779 domain-containing protein [bacterium]
MRGASGPLVDELLQRGEASLQDIPEEACTKTDGSVGAINARQLVQLRHSRSGAVWIGDGLRTALAGVRYPLHFIDFETSRLALPYHAGMRPYGLVAFQWSCHTVNRAGEQPGHSEWINAEDTWPNGKFAHALRDVIGEEGTVLAWAAHEGSTMKEILRELPAFGQSDPELDAWIQGLTTSDRILDLNRVTRESFFHPAMGGRTSIKVVLDALWNADHTMRGRFEEITGHAPISGADPYAALPPLVINGVPQQVVEGTGAMRAYQAMMYGVERTDEKARTQWRDLLVQYCGLDFARNVAYLGILGEVSSLASQSAKDTIVNPTCFFERYVGVDYSGAETPSSSLKGLRIFMATSKTPPGELHPPPSPRSYWTRKEVAQWLVERSREEPATLVGIDHGFSFPIRYFEKYHLPPAWPAFLDDFSKHWPTD